MSTDPVVGQGLRVLLNLVERQAGELAALREENQRLKDELNRLKGEQGKPDVKPGKKSTDISSEHERRSREKPEEKKTRGTKLDQLEVHRTEVRRVERKELPADAVFKGYQSVIVQELETFHQEKADLYRAGLESSSHQQIDDTAARVKGQNHHTQILCNEFYAAYFTTERKDRLTILDVLRQFESRRFLFNAETGRLLEALRVPEQARHKLAGVARDVAFGQAELDALFSTQTGYEALDERIAKTRAKQAALLIVLRYPELPLHNNDCELEARVAARRRDVSLHTMTATGTKACDTMTSLVRTAKKLGLSAFKYIRDRVSRSFQLPSLAELIRARAANYSKEPCAGIRGENSLIPN